MPGERYCDHAYEQAFFVERVTRIELALSAWESERSRPSWALTCHFGCPVVTAARRLAPRVMAR